LKEIAPGDDFLLQNIKDQAVTSDQLDLLATLSGSYQSLFNRQARKYREMELFKKELSEDEIRQLILQEYTFLKRPIFVIGSQLFICKNKDSITSLKKAMQLIRQ
jgi:arsenate reductase-like glutaredoxin family protein